jgi:class 3 adenylate cyclase
MGGILGYARVSTGEHDVAGDTPNLAARLQALAEPDAVVIPQVPAG